MPIPMRRLEIELKFSGRDGMTTSYRAVELEFPGMGAVGGVTVGVPQEGLPMGAFMGGLGG
jgi:hypothetical protein